MTDSENPRRRRRLGWLWFPIIAVLVGGGIGLGVVAFAMNSGNNDGAARPRPSTSPTVLGDEFSKPPSNSSAGSGPERPRVVTATAPRDLGPGVTRPVMVTVTNPSNQPVALTSVSITVSNASRQCHAEGNISVASYVADARGANVYVAPARGAVTVPLSITMLDTRVNQDVCKNVTFPLTFSAFGHKA